MLCITGSDVGEQKSDAAQSSEILGDNAAAAADTHTVTIACSVYLFFANGVDAIWIIICYHIVL